MARKIKITNEQYNNAISEGITLSADVEAAGGDVNKAVETTKQEARASGVDISKAKIEIPANENKLITKKQIIESRLKYLKENSTLYTIKDFLKK